MSTSAITLVLVWNRRYGPQDHQAEIFSRGKFIKSLKRKDPQDPQDHKEERFSRGKFLKSLKIKDPQDPQEESFSRASRRKILKIIKRKDSKEDSKEEFHCTAIKLFYPTLCFFRTE